MNDREVSTAVHLTYLRDRAANGPLDEDELVTAWALLERGDAAVVVALLDLLADVATDAPERLESYTTPLLDLLADTRMTDTGDIVADRAMVVIAELAETTPTIVTRDVEAVLTRTSDGDVLAKTYGCRALTQVEHIDDASARAAGEVLRDVLAETTNPHVAVAAATAIVVAPWNTPVEVTAKPHVRFDTSELDSIILNNDDEEIGQRVYEILVTAALSNPRTIVHDPRAGRFLETLYNRYALESEVSKQAYQRARLRLR